MEVESTIPHHSGRVMKEPDRYDIYDLFWRYLHIMVIDKCNDDHFFYLKAMAYFEVNLW